MIKEFFGKKLLFIDGAMGTMLGKCDCLPEILNIRDIDRIKDIHLAYLQAGADIITTNTFGANSLKLEGSDYSTREIVESGVKIARECADKYGAFVTLDIGPTGKLLSPMGDLPFEKAYDIFSEMVLAGKDADLISIETMTDTYELKAAVLAAKENSDLPIIAQVSCDKSGKLLSGCDLLSVIAMLEGLGVDAIGLNCGFGPKEFIPLFETLKKYSSTPIALLPNAGMPKVVDGETIYDFTAEEFSSVMHTFATEGAHLLGGCCGTTPEHIRLTKEKCKKITPVPPSKKDYTIVSSYGSAVLVDSSPIIIGERINPTGKKKLKEALVKGDINYILKEGISQADAGAKILDVNVGMPEIDEVKMLSKATYKLQEVLSTPLQLDSSNPEALGKAMRIYNGKPMINSVNGKKTSMDAVFPLVAKYGGVLVGLTLDERGVAETCEEKIEIAKKIIEEAAKYGISKKDIVIDPLTLTVSSNPKAALETLRALKILTEEIKVNTVLGVSNISFGLPERININTAFLTMALQNGLKFAIMNPLSEPMINAFASYNVLFANDTDCKNYISLYGGKEKSDTSAPQKSEFDLKTLITLGFKDETKAACSALLEKEKPLDIINSYIIPALDDVGADYESGKVFLPNLLSSAEAAQNAFAAIKEQSPATENKGEKILLATVYGDIHDIGKNIVKLLLENYGFDVLDLGKDVSAERIVETAIRENVKLIALSALMTTTVSAMQETIALLRQSGEDFKIMVGGAVLTESYAKEIGADFYGKDALSAVNYAKSILN